jgi:drug/metabolite transporter (DMT)-like permease
MRALQSVEGAHGRGSLFRNGLTPSHWLADSTVVLCVLAAVSEAISLICIVQLWRKRRGRFWLRLAWTLVLLAPVIGPLLYGGLFQIPPVQPPPDRASGKSWYN